MRTSVSRTSLSRRAAGLALVGVAAAASTAVIPSAASAAQVKTYLAKAPDPSGDAPALNRDIIETIFRYKDDGSVLFVVTVAAPIDATAADAGVNVSLGTTCNKILGLGIGLFSAPDTVEFAAISTAKQKVSTPREGAGEITSNVFTFLVKHPSLKSWKPGCYAVALVDPKSAEGEAPTIFDQTGEIEIKK